MAFPVTSELDIMTTREYLAALGKLKLTRASKATAAALGVTVRQCQRYAAGEAVPQTLALLLRCYLRQARQEATP